MNEASSPQHQTPHTVKAPRPLSRRQRVLMTLLTVGLLIAAAELAIRLRDAAKGYGFFNHNRDAVLRPAEVLIPFRMFGVRPNETPGKITSRHGELYPLVKAPGTFRIVCLGGSTTECYNPGSTTGVSTDYPIELQKQLRTRLNRDNIEVINQGHSAYCTTQMLLLLQTDVLGWQPDLVIASENMNDLLVNWFPDFKPDYSNAYGTSFFALPDLDRAPNLLTAIPQQFQLYWIVSNKLHTLDIGDRKKMRRSPWGDKPLPGEATFRRNLESMAAICKAHGVRFALATQAEDPREDMFRGHHGVKDYNHLIVYPTHDEFLNQHAHYNDVIRQTALKCGVLLIDNAKAMTGHPEFFIDHVHYNDPGVAYLANHMADILLESDLLGEPTSRPSNFGRSDNPG